MRVMKFGGTSVKDAARLRAVAERAAEALQATRVALVASAVSGVTNLLLDAALAAESGQPVDMAVFRFEEIHRAIQKELAKELPAELQARLTAELSALASELRDLLHGVGLLRDCPPLVRARLSALGERASCALLFALLEARGLAPLMVDPLESLPCTGDPLEATPDTEAMRERLAPQRGGGARLLLMPGFYGGGGKGRTYSLGRGGSDYSAALLAAALDAELLEIWTDVDGIYSADPRLVPEAFPLAEASFEEAMELAYFGAKVLHPKTIQPARERGIPVSVRNSFRPELPGTKVTEHAAPPDCGVRGLSFLPGMALVNLSGSGLKGVPGTAAKVFGAVAAAGVSVALITQGSSECAISFCVKDADAPRAAAAVAEAFEPELESRRVDPVELQPSLAILSIVGDGMKARVGLAGTFFGALGEVGVNVAAIAQGSSERSISAVIAEPDGPRAMAHVHRFCFATREVVDLFVAGVGTVGGELLAQIRAQAKAFEARGLELRVTGLSNSKTQAIADRGVNLGDWRGALQKGGPIELGAFSAWLREHRPALPVFVDCTSSEPLAQAYPELLDAGFHVVTANKKANSADLAHWRAVRETARRRRRRFLYETNVGAGLPVIDTLKNLVRTGDEVEACEAILSGSLSFLLGRLEEGCSFSHAVREAMAKGFTEPDPRDDLGGVDVARKLLILARDMGLELELSDVESGPFLPPDFDAEGPLEAFLSRMEGMDPFFAEAVRRASERDEVLRFVGEIRHGKARVGLRALPSSHPLAAVKGGENALSFLTRRYRPTPLVIRGYGAGPAVTAAGVLSDVLRLVEGSLG